MIYKTDEVYPQFKGEDGCFLSVDDSGIILLCRMAAPTASEKRAFHSSQGLTIAMGDFGCILYWAVRFGDLDLMDCTYSPKIGRPVQLPDIEDASQGYLLTVMLADAATGRLLKIRAVGLPHEFSKSFAETMQRISSSEMAYGDALRAIYTYSTNDLYSMASYRCDVR